VATIPWDSPLDFWLKLRDGYDWMPTLAEVGVTAQSMAIEVRQATLGDYPAIDAFIREAYKDLAPYKAHDRWRWQFVDNPFGKRGSAPPVWIALSGDRVVGQIAVQRCGLRAR
jgi:hypothetical protein